MTGFRKGGLKRRGDEETCFRKSYLKGWGLGVYLHRDIFTQGYEKEILQKKWSERGVISYYDHLHNNYNTDFMYCTIA